VGIKVLIIDDDEDLVESTKLLLEPEGIEIIGALDGDEGIIKAKSEKPDYILLDIDMPGKNGWEVLKEIKEDKELSSIPIAMLTATAISESIEREEIDRVVDYITKPFSKEDVIECIKQVYDF